MIGFTQTVSDIGVMIKRNLLRYRRLPRLIVFSFIQPVMFVLLFAYVFGGAIHTPGFSYINYLIPGIIVQTVVFGAMMTGVGLAEDVTHGMIDRFRSLPMARSAVLAGRTISETIRNFFVIIIITKKLRTVSEIVRPAKTAERAMGRERKRSTMPWVTSSAKPTPVIMAPKTTV